MNSPNKIDFIASLITINWYIALYHKLKHFKLPSKSYSIIDYLEY